MGSVLVQHRASQGRTRSRLRSRLGLADHHAPAETLERPHPSDNASFSRGIDVEADNFRTAVHDPDTTVEPVAGFVLGRARITGKVRNARPAKTMLGGAAPRYGRYVVARAPLWGGLTQRRQLA